MQTIIQQINYSSHNAKLKYVFLCTVSKHNSNYRQTKVENSSTRKQQQ